MGSGIFPFRPTDDEGSKLSQAANLVQEVLDSCLHAVYSGDAGGGQVDNAASDGASLARLNLAVELIRKEIKP